MDEDDVDFDEAIARIESGSECAVARGPGNFEASAKSLLNSSIDSRLVLDWQDSEACSRLAKSSTLSFELVNT